MEQGESRGRQGKEGEAGGRRVQEEGKRRQEVKYQFQLKNRFS